MKDSKKKVQKSNSWIFLLLICVATCFMGVGFARIDIVLDITGNLATTPQNNIFITDVNYVSDVSADLNNSNIINTYQTILNSNIALSETDANSKITYEITVYNSTDSDYKFVKTDYILGDDTYDNEKIIFSLENLAVGDGLKSKQSVTFKITFYYKDNTIPSDNELKSLINFVFEPHAELVLAGTLINVGNTSSGIFGSSLSKTEIEKIYFVAHENVPENASNVWDASEEGNYAITGWTVDEDQNGKYELYLGANDGKIVFPADSSYIFASYSSVTLIEFDNIYTTNVTNMKFMFNYSTALTSLDLTTFDTSNVTSMANMFYFANNLISLDLSSFDTSNVTNVNYMFYYLYKLETLKLNNATLSHIESTYSSAVFMYVPSTVYIVAKDDVERDWIQAKLGTGKGTIVTVAEL